MADNTHTMLDVPSFVTLVEKHLVKYCEQKIIEAATIGAQYEALWGEIKDYVAGGGKRIRPQLAYMTYIGYGGQDTTTILPIASAWELLHSSLLVIDDIIDRDTMRHGRLNISGRYQHLYNEIAGLERDHYALSAAMLAGDLLLVSAYDLISRSQLDPQDKISAINLLQKAFFEVGGGEHMDVVSVFESIEDANPLSIIRYKTVGYSFQLPMRSGANLAGAHETELTKLDAIGEQLGTVFQLTDDLLGVFGDPNATGKTNSSDIREKKRTALVQNALRRLSPALASRLEELYSTASMLSDDQVKEVYTILSNSGAQEEIMHELRQRSEATRAMINDLTASVVLKRYLTDLADRLELRLA